MDTSRVRILVAISLSLLAASCNRSSQYYLEAGNRLYALSDLEGASLAYRKALQLDHQSGEALYRLGLAQAKQEKFQDAYTSFQQALPLLPQNEDLRVKFADLGLGSYAADPSRPRVLYDQVRLMSDDLLRINPRSFDGIRLRGQLALLDAKLKEAIELFRTADEIRPMQPECIQPLVQALISVGEYSEAERLSLALVDHNKSYGPIYNVLYLMYIATHRDAQAEAILKTKVQNNPADVVSVLELANHYINVKKPQDLAATMQSLVANPRIQDARLSIGDFFTEKRDYDQALHYYESGEAQARLDQKPLYRKRTVLVYRAQGKRTEAERVLDSLIASNPNDEDSRNMRATMRLENGQPSELAIALTELKALVERKPGVANYHYNLGRVHYVLGDLDAAKQEMNETARLQSDFSPARFYLADISQRQGQFASAQRYAEEILLADPRNVRAGLSRAAALISLRNYGEARAQLNRLILDNPAADDVHLQLGLLEVVEGRFAEADRIFRKYYQADQTDLRALRGLVESSVARNQLDQATQLLVTELKRSPGSVPVRVALAQVHRLAGRTDEALDQFQQVAAAAPQLDDIHVSIGQLLELKGDATGALAAYRRALDQNPSNAPAAGFSAQALTNLGRTDEAITRYRQSLRLQPTNPQLLNNLAYALADSGQSLDEALELAQRAMSALPQNDGVQDTVGWVYLKKGATDSALQVFNNVVKKQPDRATYHLHLAMALSQKGDKEGSRRALENALANRPSEREKVEIQRLLDRLKVG